MKLTAPHRAAKFASRLYRLRGPQRLEAPGEVVVCAVRSLAAPDRHIAQVAPPAISDQIPTEWPAGNRVRIERERQPRSAPVGATVPVGSDRNRHHRVV